LLTINEIKKFLIDYNINIKDWESYANWNNFFWL
jgi:hypothetical protein